jgi:hypothetical protein
MTRRNDNTTEDKMTNLFDITDASDATLAAILEHGAAAATMSRARYDELNAAIKDDPFQLCFLNGDDNPEGEAYWAWSAIENADENAERERLHAEHEARSRARIEHPCPRCSGRGRIYYYSHIDSGICFRCGGSGVAPR